MIRVLKNIFRYFDLKLLKKRFRKNKDFDVKSFDDKLLKYSDDIYNLLKNQTFTVKNKNSNEKPNNKNIIFLASNIYNMGGHTKCIKDLAFSLVKDYNEMLFLTKRNVNSNESLESFSELKGIFSNVYCDNLTNFKISSIFRYDKKFINFICKIVEFNPKTIIVYMEPNDIFGTIVLGYIRKYTNIKILYFNHASHYPCLAMTYSHKILEALPATENITKTKRHLENTEIVGLQSLRKNDTVYFSEEEKNKKKKEIGVNSGDLITMSGGSSYKFFDGDKSKYFEMIYDLLTKEKNLKHVIISEFREKEMKIIDRIFNKNPELKKRLIFLKFSKNFDLLFQCADVFVDSFPVSSALTQLDLMRNRVASVVKINKQNPEYSFHEYQMKNYKYMFENAEDMENAIIKLLHDKDERTKIIDENYNYWLNTYEMEIVKNKYVKIIEGIANE